MPYPVTLKKKKKRQHKKETVTWEICLCFVTPNLFHAGVVYSNKLSGPWGCPNLSLTVSPTSSLRSSRDCWLILVTFTGHDSGPDFTWAQICLLPLDLPSSLDSWLNTVTITRSALLTLLGCSRTALSVSENFTVWIRTHKLQQLLLRGRNYIAFIISLLSLIILEVTPNAYFFTMWLDQIIPGLSHLHLYGTWLHLLLHNFNEIKSFLTLECYLSAFFIILSFKPNHFLVLLVRHPKDSYLQRNIMTSEASGFSSSLWVFYWFFCPQRIKRRKSRD